MTLSYDDITELLSQAKIKRQEPVLICLEGRPFGPTRKARPDWLQSGPCAGCGIRVHAPGESKCTCSARRGTEDGGQVRLCRVCAHVWDVLRGHPRPLDVGLDTASTRLVVWHAAAVQALHATHRPGELL